PSGKAVDCNSTNASVRFRPGAPFNRSCGWEVSYLTEAHNLGQAGATPVSRHQLAGCPWVAVNLRTVDAERSIRSFGSMPLILVWTRASMVRKNKEGSTPPSGSIWKVNQRGSGTAC